MSLLPLVPGSGSVTVNITLPIRPHCPALLKTLTVPLRKLSFPLLSSIKIQLTRNVFNRLEMEAKNLQRLPGYEERVTANSSPAVPQPSLGEGCLLTVRAVRRGGGPWDGKVNTTLFVVVGWPLFVHCKKSAEVLPPRLTSSSGDTRGSVRPW